jgi:hypothetical protein
MAYDVIEISRERQQSKLAGTPSSASASSSAPAATAEPATDKV